MATRLDAYDLLLQGNTANDQRLLAGDVIFVPPVGLTAAAGGHVRRPAIYELKPGNTVGDLLNFAGGLKPDADPQAARIARISEGGKRITLDVNLAAAQGRAMPLRTGDELDVLTVRPALQGAVEINGAVYRPRVYEYRSGLRLTDALPSIDDLTPNADPAYVVIRRQPEQPGRVSVLSADLRAAWSGRGTAADPLLQPRDRVLVLSRSAQRSHELDDLIADLRAQARIDEPAAVVEAGGQVASPGTYPLEEGMTLAGLLGAGGSLQTSALGGTAELIRYEVVNGETRQQEIVEVDIAAARRGDVAANLKLRAYDRLNVKRLEDWGSDETVELRGEVRFPGVYPIKRSDTLKSVIERAGGLTPYAQPFAAAFTRVVLREREQQQLDQLNARVREDIAMRALVTARATAQNSQAPPSGGAAAGAGVEMGLLTQLGAVRPVGRLVIDLEAILREPVGSSVDIPLRDGDLMVVPRMSHEVSVIDHVQNAASHVYEPDWSMNGYIDASGGITRNGDRRMAYVVHANGAVEKNNSRWWSARGGGLAVGPGDTIVVPPDLEHTPGLPLWQAVTQILYNLTVSLAAVKTF